MSQSIQNNYQGLGRIALKVIQVVMLLLAPAILVLLIYKPVIGMKLFWGVIITLGPLLFALIPSLWRNICPLGIVSILPRWLGLSAGRKLSPDLQRKLIGLGFALLLLIPPLRSIFFDRYEMATAGLLFAFGLLAFSLGIYFDARGAYCSSLCPILFVEAYYGQFSWVRMRNSVCGTCTSCVPLCYEKRDGGRLLEKMSTDSKLNSLVEFFIGGFPGYVYGWFRTPVLFGETFGTKVIFELYWAPLSGMFFSFGLYTVLKQVLHHKSEHLSLLASFYSLAALVIYYWYRIPVVIGFGKYSDDAIMDITYYVSETALLVTRSVLPVLLVIFWLYNLKFRKKALKVTGQ